MILQVFGGNYSDYVWHDAQGAWDTGRLTQILNRETEKRLGVKLRTLDHRHTAVGIGRVYVGESFSKGYQDDVGEIEEAEVDDDSEDILELQNSRITAMGVGNYSVPMDIVKNLSVRSMDASRPLSMAWRKLLGVDGTSEARQTAVMSKVHGAKKRPLRDGIYGLALPPRNKEVRVEDPREDSIRKALQLASLSTGLLHVLLFR